MSFRPIDPLNALAYANTLPLICSRDIRKPGALIALLDKDNREALERLTSDDLAKMRVNPSEFCETDHERLERVVGRKIARP